MITGKGSEVSGPIGFDLQTKKEAGDLLSWSSELGPKQKEK